MISHFPEIESFFSQNEFEENELKALKEKIESTYKDKQIIKAAESLIHLKLLLYENFSNEEINNLKRHQTKTQETINRNSSRPLKKPKEEKKIIVVDTNSFLKEMSNKSIDELSKKLKISSSLIIRNFSKIDIIKESKKDFVSLEELKSIHEFIEYQLNRIMRQTKNEDVISKIKTQKKTSLKNNLVNENESVFEKMSKYGVGKIIYIRKS